ncbi:uncharacterized protein STEHIDRAFT_149604 [Stereum hirsutum FP-91666 SS1]|uniref:uncharacterized protein n=1 Tax=Stereum hirsutum (strain FP-91666) TaxID=721885 RepID=UPI0004449C7E|nr:uncharacterized protein STEHIDRAFT_149604 [Stereum hirsutum FP-91666 SS1]EIM81814.1 hypothetical protein STEHIDRAFT_149604 [Stereum hirsutum FP-91666 SS1]
MSRQYDPVKHLPKKASSTRRYTLGRAIHQRGYGNCDVILGRPSHHTKIKAMAYHFAYSAPDEP